MWYWIKPILISILIIFTMHNLINYFKDTYTTKKTKDIVGFHVQKYKTIMNEIQEINEREKQILIQKVVDAEKTMAEISTKDNMEKTILSDNDLQAVNDDLTSFIQTYSNE